MGAVHRVLSTRTAYTDPGFHALRAHRDDHQRRQSIRNLEKLGYKVTLEETHPAAQLPALAHRYFLSRLLLLGPELLQSASRLQDKGPTNARLPAVRPEAHR